MSFFLSSLRCSVARNELVKRPLSSALGDTVASKPMRTRRLSGAQREVLALYRSWLRAIKSKPVEAKLRDEMRDHVREQFKRNAKFGLLEVDRIQSLMSRGRKQLQYFRDTDRGFSVR